MTRVAVVNYGMGNLDSVVRAFEECGANVVVAGEPSGLETATHLVLPGVGAFGDGMRHIRERGFDTALREQALERRIPLLGLCLGMQLLAERGEEHGDHAGLGLIPGTVVRLRPTTPEERVPHVGWNDVEVARPTALLGGLESGANFYFVHSYHMECRDDAHVLGRTPYCGTVASVVGRDHVFGVQFHPEKSQRAGFRLLRNFLAM
jgi:glutamine amidotransferase